MAIGAAWADGSWVDAGWITDAWLSGATTHEVNLLLASQLAANKTSNAIFNTGIVFASALSDTETKTADYQAAITGLAQSLGYSLIVETDGMLEGSLVFTTNISTLLDANADMGVSALFANSLTVDLQGGNDISAQVAYAILNGETASSEITIEGSLLLELDQLLTSTNTMAAEAALLLNHQFALTAINQGIINAGLTLSALQTINITGGSLVAGIVTPSGRTITVTTKPRTINITSDRNT